MRIAAGRRTQTALIAIGLAAALITGACTNGTGSGDPSHSSAIPQPDQATLAAAGLDELPVAAAGKRVDLTLPAFSNPTKITNPLFPISELQSVILSGKVEEGLFHTETTLLPETKVVEWNDQRFETRVSQYFAYTNGRIEEVATDYYAQADDGSVWYFGEDLFDYDEEGVINSTDGAWLVGRDGPPAMIMPGDPKVGDVHRAENIPGIAFEEVAVKTVGKTVDGPRGRVEGALVASELHDDGTYSDKVFAPGYGEFYSAHDGDVEALALAVPTDALEGPVPAALKVLSSSAGEAFEASRAGEWTHAASATKKASAAWDTYRAGQVPPRLAIEMTRAIKALAAGVASKDATAAGDAAVDVAQSTLDLELRYLPQTEIDLGRFELWARQILIDAGAGDLGGVRGDLATLEWIRDRFTHELEDADVTRIAVSLRALRDSVIDEDLAASEEEAVALRDKLATIALR